MFKIDFSNPAIIKLCLLCDGVRIAPSVLKEIGILYAEDRFRYHRVSKIPMGFKYVPSELILPKDIVSAVYIEEKSPWLIKKNQKGEVRLFYKDKEICPTSFTKRPNFYDKKLSNNTLCKQTAVMYGNYVLGIFIMGWCYFPAKNVGCKFCSIGSNWSKQGLGTQNLKFVTPQIAQEAVATALSTDKKRIKYIMYSSGSFPDNNKGFQIQTDVVRAVKKEIQNFSIPQHFTIMPPDTFSLMKDIKDAGLTTIAFDIEVFDKDTFGELCPGKEKYYGYDKFIDALEYAISIFGWGNVHCGYVAGLEKLEMMFKGFHSLGKKGIVSDANIFHPDPQSGFENKPRPSKEYVFEMVKEQAKTYKKYKFVSIFPIGGRRGSLDTEVYKGYFN